MMKTVTTAPMDGNFCKAEMIRVSYITFLTMIGVPIELYSHTSMMQKLQTKKIE